MDRRLSTQDISWFLDLNRNNQLYLDPPYQRRSVWSLKDRRFFLDTIFRSYPSPSIFLHKHIDDDGKTKYDVVDGKQRLETILKFANNNIGIDQTFGDKRFNGKKWKQLGTDEKKIFWDYVIPVEFINISEDTALVNGIFDRLNRNVRRLVDQELRHANYDGGFITFVEDEENEPNWKTLGLVTTARVKRMKTIQFLSELLIIILKYDISGFDQNEIDKYYAKYDDPLAEDIGFEQQELQPQYEEFDKEKIKQQFVEARQVLIELEEKNSSVTKYANDFKNLYSLWALVALNKNKISDIKLLAEKYASFMEDVQKFKGQNLEALSKQDKRLQSLKYYQNSLGASTDLLQRRERYAALKTILE